MSHRNVFALLRVGLEVEVEGRLLSNGHILAEEIEIHGMVRGLPPFIIINPPARPPRAFPPAPGRGVPAGAADPSRATGR